MADLHVRDAKSIVRHLVPDASERDVEVLANRIKSPILLRESDTYGTDGGERSIASSMRIFADLFPTASSGYRVSDLRANTRIDSGAAVDRARLESDQQELATRLSGDQKALTLKACFEAWPSLEREDRSILRSILEQHFGFTTPPQEKARDWQSVLPSIGGKTIASTDLGQGVTVSLVEELYATHDGIEAIQGLRIRSQPGDVLITPIGYGSNMGPYIPDQLFAFGDSGTVDLPVRHLYPDWERFAVLRPAKEPGGEPTLLAKVEARSPARRVDWPAEVVTPLSEAELREVIRERVEPQAMETAQRLLLQDNLPRLAGSPRPDLQFIPGSLPSGLHFIEVPLPGLGGGDPVTAHVDLGAHLSTREAIASMPLTYVLHREKGAHSEIAGPFSL